MTLKQMTRPGDDLPAHYLADLVEHLHRWVYVWMGVCVCGSTKQNEQNRTQITIQCKITQIKLSLA